MTYLPKFTAEQMAFLAGFADNAMMAANPMWGLQIAAAGAVDVTDPRVVTGVAAAVAGGVLTSARGSQVLNLAVSSP